MTQELRKINDFVGCRMTINPELFADQYPTRFGNRKALFADVTIHWPSTDQHLGQVYIFNQNLINEIKQHWVGQPIEGTLRQKHDPTHRGLTILTLENVEVK